MALTHVVDSSVLTRLGRAPIREVIEPMVERGELAAAEARNLSVLHYDADFDRIAAVTGQPCRWVVPAGFVD
jgi:hypothetical protein